MMKRRRLSRVLIFFMVASGFGATDLPSRYAFDRYTPLLGGAQLFGLGTAPYCSRKITPQDLYIESIASTSAGDVVRLRSVKDPNFSMTFTTKSGLISPGIWKTPDTSP
jgi:hypothetical protein